MAGWMSGNAIESESQSIADQLIAANEFLRKENARLWAENQELRALVARLESRLDLAELRNGRGREIE